MGFPPTLRDLREEPLSVPVRAFLPILAKILDIHVILVVEKKCLQPAITVAGFSIFRGFHSKALCRVCTCQAKGGPLSASLLLRREFTCRGIHPNAVGRDRPLVSCLWLRASAFNINNLRTVVRVSRPQVL